MNSIYLLIPIALIFVVIAVVALFWAIGSQQYDDLDVEGSRILFEEDETSATSDKTSAINDKEVNKRD